MNRERVLRLIAATCLSREGRARVTDPIALGEWLDEHDIVGDDRAFVLAQAPRLGVYRTLVRNNLASVVFKVLARTRRLVNAACSDAFDDGFVTFLDEYGPRSPLLRALPGELAVFLLTSWSANPAMPVWASELLDYELARFESDAAPPPPSPTGAAPNPILDLQSRIEPLASTKLARYTFAVHEVLEGDDESETPIVLPEARPTHLVVSRDANGVVHTTETSAWVYNALDALFEGGTIGESVRSAAASLGVPLTSAALDELARRLALLAERGAIEAATGT